MCYGVMNYCPMELDQIKGKTRNNSTTVDDNNKHTVNPS